MSQTAKEYLEAQVKRLAAEMETTVKAARDAGRDLTDEENQKIEAQLAEVGKLKGRIDEIEAHEKMLSAIQGITAPVAVASSETPKTVGEAFAKGAGYQRLKARGNFALSVGESTEPIEWGQKLTDAGLSVVATSDAGGTLPLQPQVLPVVGRTDENPLVIANLFGQGVASQNTLVYLEETTTTPGVLNERYSDSDSTLDTTTEGEAKPAAYVDFTKRTKTLTKLAAFLPVTDEMLEDEPAIVSYIDGRLGLFIRQAEDQFLLSEILTATVATSAAGDVGGSNRFDAIAAGIADVQIQGGTTPDAIIINPLDFWRMSVSKSAGDGNYFTGSPYRSPQDNPWGIPVVVTNAIRTGTALVGAFRAGATVWRKGGVVVDASNSHSDYFRKNLTAIRAHLRLALTVFRPGMFSKVSL